MTPLCAALFAIVGLSSPTAEQKRYCEDIESAARAADIRAEMLLSLAYHESRLTDATSSAGARGPLQVLPRYFCPGGKETGCDLVQAGVRAYLAWQKHASNDIETICKYNAGYKCGKRSIRYARAVIRLAKRIGLEVESKR